MNRKIFHYLQIAAKVAVTKEDRRNFLVGAVGIRKDQSMVVALNSPTELPNPKIHAEWKLSSKLDYYSTVYVARIRLDTGGFGIAKPCHSCMAALTYKKVKRIYYSIDDNEYGCIHADSL
jgi:tRNA(Arg) A34 adenosine deaminase TadA